MLFALGLPGCGSSPTNPTPPPAVGSPPAATASAQDNGTVQPRATVVKPTVTATDYLKVAFLLATDQDPRQEQFKQLFIDNTKNVTGTVIVESADNDPLKQRAQVEDALGKGAPVLVIQPVDSDAAASYVDAAHKAGAKVIAFERLINSRDLDAYVSHDSGQIGRLQAQAALDWLKAKGVKTPYNFVFLEGPAGDTIAAGITRGYHDVLDPLITKGDVKVTADQAHNDWSADLSAKTTQDALTKAKNNIHAVLANSSSLARGALTAVDAQKLTGKVFVAGAGADADSLKAICASTQNLDVVEDDAALPVAAAKLAVALSNDVTIADTQLAKSIVKIADRQIPLVGIPVKAITLDTIQAQLVQSGDPAGSTLGACFPALPAGAVVPTTTASGNLLIWTQEDPTGTVYPYLANLAAQFAAANIAVDVKIESYDADTLRKKFQEVAGTADAPDLVWTTSDAIESFGKANLIQATDFYTPAIGSGVFVDSAAAAATRDGRVYGIPVSNGNNLVLYYNKKLIKDPPANTDALIRLAPTLTKANGAQWTMMYDQSNPLYLIPWLGGFKGSVLAESGLTATLNTSAMTDTLKLMKDLQDKKVVSPDADGITADAFFKESKAAMIINSDSAVGDYVAKLGTDLGVARIPTVSKTNESPHPYTGASVLLFPAAVNGEKLQLAQAFAQFLSSKPIQLDMARRFRRMPALKEALNDATITADPILKGLSDQMQLGIAQPNSPPMSCVWDAIKPNMQAALTGKSTPVDAAKAMQSSADECIAKIP